MVLEDDSQQNEAVEKVNGAAIGDRKITAKVAQEMKPIEDKEGAENDPGATGSTTDTPAALEAKVSAST